MSDAESNRLKAALLAVVKRVVALERAPALAKGDPGRPGKPPRHQWQGTRLAFELPDGSYVLGPDLRGKTPGHKWEGTRLLVEGPDGTYRSGPDLKGEKGDEGLPGPAPHHRWDGTRVMFERPQGGFGQAVDVRGEPGPQGLPPDHRWEGTRLTFLHPGGVPGQTVDLKGERGPAPAHKWDGTKLQFQNPDGSWGKKVDLRGPPGGVLRGGGGGAGKLNRAGVEQAICEFLKNTTPVQGVDEYTVLQSDRALYVRAIDGPVTVYLLDATEPATCPIEIKRSEDSTFEVVAVPFGAQTVDSEPERAISVAGDTLRLKPHDGNWKEY